MPFKGPLLFFLSQALNSKSAGMERRRRSPLEKTAANTTIMYWQQPKVTSNFQPIQLATVATLHDLQKEIFGLGQVWTFVVDCIFPLQTFLGTSIKHLRFCHQRRGPFSFPIPFSNFHQGLGSGRSSHDGNDFHLIQYSSLSRVLPLLCYTHTHNSRHTASIGGNLISSEEIHATSKVFVLPLVCCCCL